MKTTFHIALLLLLFTATSFTSQAQKQWTKDMLEYKHNFIAKETGMTQEQRDKFMPLYEAMEKEIYAVHHNAKEQAKKITATSRQISDSEYENVARAMNSVKAKEGEIENRYFERFAKILSKKQLFLLKKAEIKFTRDMVAKRKK